MQCSGGRDWVLLLEPTGFVKLTNAEDDEVALFCILWEVETAPEIGQTEEIARYSAYNHELWHLISLSLSDI